MLLNLSPLRQAAGFEPRVAFGSDDDNAVQAFIAVGLGIGILPHLALSFMRPGLHRIPLAAPPVRHITAARLARRCSACSRRPRTSSSVAGPRADT